MDRRSFSKLFIGSLTTAGISKIHAQELPPTHSAQAKSAFREHESTITAIPPAGGSNAWELVIPYGSPPHITETAAYAAADIDGDTKTELIVGGNGALLWYRPSTSERGVVALGEFGVGVAVEDIDGDGRMEIVIGKQTAASRQAGRLESLLVQGRWGSGRSPDGVRLRQRARRVIRTMFSSATWTATAGAKW